MALKTRHWDRLGNGGLTFTELGFGTAPLGNLYTAISDAEADAVLARAWDAGVRYYDTAPLKKTLERLVDFDRINDLKTRLSVGAVGVTSTSTNVDVVASQ